MGLSVRGSAGLPDWQSCCTPSCRLSCARRLVPRVLKLQEEINNPLTLKHMEAKKFVSVFFFQFMRGLIPRPINPYTRGPRAKEHAEQALPYQDVCATAINARMLPAFGERASERGGVGSPGRCRSGGKNGEI